LEGVFCTGADFPIGPFFCPYTIGKDKTLTAILSTRQGLDLYRDCTSLKKPADFVGT